jgi:hypothetical protein
MLLIDQYPSVNGGKGWARRQTSLSNVVEGKGEIKSRWVVNTNSSSTIHGRNRTSYRGISNDFFS